MPIYMDPLITGNPFKHCTTLQELKEVTMPVNDRWFRKSPEPQFRRASFMNMDDDQKEYEDPDCYYSKPPELGQFQVMQKQIPPPLPPPLSASQKIAPIHYSLKHKPQRKTRNWKVILLGSLLCIVSFLLLISLISLIIIAPSSRHSSDDPSTSEALQLNANTNKYSIADNNSKSGHASSKLEAIEVNPNFLLTLLITKRKVCLFEASTDRHQKSWQDFREEHIETARFLFFGNLSHNGAPVHPLQFQRYVRNLGVDNDCHVIIYDRGDTIWATYAFWIFTLFGHSKVSLLNGGFEEWKRLKSNSEQYRTESGPGAYVKRSGNFRAEWKSDVICTFDDVLTNSELKTHDLVDAQDKEEYNGIGKGAIFGHIRSAVNIPIDEVFDWHSQHWFNRSSLIRVFNKATLSHTRPIIVYCSTSVRSSMIWFALRQCDYKAAIYFGSWPEWLIRAPDFLKVIPENAHRL